MKRSRAMPNGLRLCVFRSLSIAVYSYCVIIHLLFSTTHWCHRTIGLHLMVHRFIASFYGREFLLKRKPIRAASPQNQHFPIKKK